MPPVPRGQVNGPTEEGPDLSPAEAARELGVSIKALKVYERRGMVRPRRALNGYRVYGPAELGQVRQIVALKALGLTLAQIAQLLTGPAEPLWAALEDHHAELCEERRRLDRAIALVDAARAAMRGGKAPRPEDIAALAARAPPKGPRWHERLNAFYAAHLDDAQWKVVETRSLGLWAALIAELKALCAADADPASAEAQRLFRRWVAAAHASAGGDPEIVERCSAAWTAAASDPDLGPNLPIGEPELVYLGRLHEAKERLQCRD